jgi:acyl carrier protein
MTKDEMLILLIEEIKKMSVDESLDLNEENAGKIIIEQLQIDSLEAIEWAMNLEIRLGIEFEIAGFAKTATLDELAVYLLGLKNKIVEDAS